MFNFRSALVPVALAAALAAPIVACAQQSSQSSTQPTYTQGQDQAQGQGRRHHGFGWMRELKSLNLSASQQSQIKQLMDQYRQAHPRGSAPDPQAREQLRSKIMAVLTPAQQTQLKTEMQQARARFGERGGRFPAPAPSPSPRG